MKLLVAISFWKIPVSSKTPSQGHRPAGVDLKGLSNFQKTGVFCQALLSMKLSHLCNQQNKGL